MSRRSLCTLKSNCSTASSVLKSKTAKTAHLGFCLVGRSSRLIIIRLESSADARYSSEARYAEAEQHYRKALELWQQKPGSEASVALTLNNLGILLRREARYSEAETVDLQALKMFEELFGPEHEKTAAALIRAFGDLDTLKNALDKGHGGFPPGTRKKLEAARDYLDIAPPVVRTATDVPLADDIDGALPAAPPDPELLTEMGAELGLGSSLARFRATVTR